MSNFTLKNACHINASAFAIGKHTGTLYLMTGQREGIVIVGKGAMAGREGQLHSNYEIAFDRIQTGTIIEIVA